MRVSELLLSGLAPPLCAACSRTCGVESPLCGPCARRLDAAVPLSGAGPAGVERAWSSAAHEGVARELVAALKFGRRLPLADLMAARIAALCPSELLSGCLVPAPTAPLRAALRGFDPAAELAAALSERTGLPVDGCLRRRGGRRQVGRRRAERVGRPPLVRAASPAPRSAVLVDDVLTTGATLTACAAALRRAGAIRVAAVTFSRRL